MKIGVLTSGGDAPGMNAAIRTVVVAGVARGHEVLGVRRGYAGLLEADAPRLSLDEVDGIARFGGTVLGSARSPLFATEEGQAQAEAQIRALGLDALVVIGGNGSLTGAHRLSLRGACLVIGVPASIDNDIGHTRFAIGVDTAINTIVEACDRISDTARAHRRAFIVEVMGRHCGFLAMRAGIAADADAILHGEEGLSEDELVLDLSEVLRKCFAPGRNKTRALIIKAEGVKVATSRLAERLQAVLDAELPDVDLRVTVLGHVVRGGSPSAMDRVIAQRLAFAAVLASEAGEDDEMVSWDPFFAPGRATPDSSVRLVPLPEVLEETARLLDGSSPIVKKRIALLKQVREILVF
jgi:6-phosphofructokinase 1